MQLRRNKNRGLELHPRLLPPPRWGFRIVWVTSVVLALASALWAWLQPPPLPPLPDDAAGYADCWKIPHGEGCDAWPIGR